MNKVSNTKLAEIMMFKILYMRKQVKAGKRPAWTLNKFINELTHGIDKKKLKKASVKHPEDKKAVDNTIKFLNKLKISRGDNNGKEAK